MLGINIFPEKAILVMDKREVRTDGQKNKSGSLFGKYKYKAKRAVSVEEIKIIVKNKAGR
jgi:hypothetical protein